MAASTVLYVFNKSTDVDDRDGSHELEDGSVLLRLAHLYEMGEDKNLSVMASVDLEKLFPNRKISKLTEVSLSTNQEKAEMLKKRLVWQVEADRMEDTTVRGGPVDVSKPVVMIGPMEIRTFIINFDYISSPVG